MGSSYIGGVSLTQDISFARFFAKQRGGFFSHYYNCTNPEMVALSVVTPRILAVLVNLPGVDEIPIYRYDDEDLDAAIVDLREPDFWESLHDEARALALEGEYPGYMLEHVWGRQSDLTVMDPRNIKIVDQDIKALILS